MSTFLMREVSNIFLNACSLVSGIRVFQTVNFLFGIFITFVGITSPWVFSFMTFIQSRQSYCTRRLSQNAKQMIFSQWDVILVASSYATKYKLIHFSKKSDHHVIHLPVGSSEVFYSQQSQPTVILTRPSDYLE